MRLVHTEISGLFILEGDPKSDERGYFHRLYDTAVFEASHISFSPRQSGLSHNIKALTLRGMHYQTGATAQAKLVRCLSGRLFDVAIDLRPDSPTFSRWLGIELTAENHRALFIPKGFAHGFLTLQDNTDVLYELSHPENITDAAGVRWNDPSFKITWPEKPKVVN